MFSSTPQPRRRRRQEDHVREQSRDRDRDREKDRDHNRHRPPCRASNKDDRETEREHGGYYSNSSASSTPKATKRVTMVLPEMQRRKESGSAVNSRPQSIPYPSFSKAHSREAVGSAESLKQNPLTPETTDLGRAHNTKNAPPKTASRAAPTTGAPPSPPLTAEHPIATRAASGSSMKKTADNARDGHFMRRKSADGGELYPASNKSFSASRSSLRLAEEGSGDPAKSFRIVRPASANQVRHSSKKQLSVQELSPTRKASPRKKTHSRRHNTSITDSDATSVAPERERNRDPPTLIAHDESFP